MEATGSAVVPGMTPAVASGAAAGVPLEGTGLAGRAWGTGERIWSIPRFDEIAAADPPTARFAASEIAFGSRHSDTTLAEFLAANGQVTGGDGTMEMGPSGLILEGYVYIPAGEHEITVRSDDGFALRLGGVDFMAYEGARGVDATSRTAEFEGGLYALDLRYFDQGGKMALSMEVDGLPVDQSAFYATTEDFLSPPEGATLVPEEEYHPSHTLGALTVDDPETIATGAGPQRIEGLGGDDTITAGDGDDIVHGGHGDDSIEGGAGDDLLDGGYGSDLLIGGAGNDLLVSRSDGGEQKIAQRYVIDETRPADGWVNPATDKLYGYEDQPLIGDDILVGGAGADTFLIAPQINAVLPIIQEHVKSDGSIRWAGVAGENDFQHAHWVDLFGFDLIADYDAGEDHIAVIGHTVNVHVEHVDYDSDGVTESVITAVSKQHGAGGAHDRDLVGVVFVEGDLVQAADIQTDAGVTYGVVESYADVAQAVHLVGDTKTVTEGGTTHHGYDYRGPGEVMRAPEGDAADLMDNPYWADAQAHVAAPGPDAPPELKGAPFAPAERVAAEGQTITGTGAADRLAPVGPAAPEGLPGALGVWALGDGPDGAYADARGAGPAAKAYTLYENQAVLRTDGAAEGPRPGTAALTFDGEDQFAYLAHDPAFAVTNGTIALWVRADDLSDDGAILAKDQRGTGDGGHFRLVQEEDGHLLLRMAPGYGGGNKSWITTAPVLEEGVWAHLAVSFTAQGVTVYKDGAALDDALWAPKSGDVPSPGAYMQASLIRNAEPWVFGADQNRTKINDTAQVFATDDEDLRDPFHGALAEFGLWGGMQPGDALTGAEIARLAAEGPGAALTNPAGPQPVRVSDDVIAGQGGNDTMEGGAGADTMDGGAGDDELFGGHGDDSLEGGAGDDVLDGGYGADLLIGGAGNDLLVSRSDGGEQKIAQRYVIDETRPDGGQVDPATDKLYGYGDQPLIGDDILVGGAGRDTFLISPQINATLPIIEEHLRSDGTIRWNKVAGENTYQHDHWVDLFGFELIADYDAEEDHIAVIGHTAVVHVDHVDYDSDGVTESVITAISKQHGAGGAHDRDLLGVVFVEGDLVDADAIQTDDGVTYGVVEHYAEAGDALYQPGDTKTVTEGGTTHHGYDYRGPGEVMRAPEGDAADLMDNPYWAEAQAHVTGPSPETGPELTRAPFEPLGFVAAAGQSVTGTAGGDAIAPEAPPAPAGLPGALGVWALGAGGGAAFADGRGALGEVKAYTLYENQARLRSGDETGGPRPGTSALTFDGETDFAYLAHDAAFEVTQGTIALWVRADDLSDEGAIVTKDQRGSGDGGHFRLIQEEDGHLLLRFAPGDGDRNVAWKTTAPVLEEGVWAHLAVSFTDRGVTVYKDGAAIDDALWLPEEGAVPAPGIYREAYLLRNEEPWVFGADQSRTEVNDTAQAFATDDEDLRDPFEGALAEFAIWGGFTPDAALTADQVARLAEEGPGAALTNPSGPQPMIASDDRFDGAGGNDTIEGGAGDDVLLGGAGDDLIEGGYGDDRIEGGAGDDTMDGGRGSDFVLGGDGNDTMIAGGDVGEDRAGQLVLHEMGVDQPIRPYPDPSIDAALLKLVDWTDQPLYADDVFLGGAGADHMAVRTYINGKKDAILDNVVSGTRVIDWGMGGVAGENDRVHDHWVDGIGIDIFGDFDAAEDRISVIGHTTNIEISYDAVDTDGDGMADSVLSLIRAYSQQGRNGGAHDEDELGILAVIGDLVTEEMVETDAGAHYGIVSTIDELQEALAPSDDPSPVARPEGVFGYDDRDVAGRPMTSDPLGWSVNPFMDEAEAMFDWQVAGGPGPVAVVNAHDGGDFDGSGHMEMAHDPGEQQAAGTYLLSFTADSPGAGDQALLSKDHSGYQDGGHLTLWIDDRGYLKARYQSDSTSEYLKFREKIEAGHEYDVAFTYGPDGAALFVDGQLADAEPDFGHGMEGNANSTVLGASARRRKEDDLKPEWQFDGEIRDVAVLDTQIGLLEALVLLEAGNDPAALVDAPVPAPEPAPEPEPEPEPAPAPAPEPEPAPAPEPGPLPIEPAPTVRVELGSETVMQPGRDTWHEVSFEREIENAVVVMGPLQHLGSHDAVVRVRDVTSTGFEFQIEEWDYLDGWHTTETVGWMAVEAGTHALASGQVISAGSVTSNTDYDAPVQVALEGFDAAPSVFAQVASHAGGQTVTTRLRDIEADGFGVLLQEQEASDDWHRPERVDWIALDEGVDGLIDLSDVPGGLSGRYETVGFDPVDDVPVALAAMQTMRGGDTASLRFRDLDADSIGLRVAEEQSRDAERGHVTEDVALLVSTEGSHDLLLA